MCTSLRDTKILLSAIYFLIIIKINTNKLIENYCYSRNASRVIVKSEADRRGGGSPNPSYDRWRSRRNYPVSFFFYYYLYYFCKGTIILFSIFITKRKPCLVFRWRDIYEQIFFSVFSILFTVWDLYFWKQFCVNPSNRIHSFNQSGFFKFISPGRKTLTSKYSKLYVIKLIIDLKNLIDLS